MKTFEEKFTAWVDGELKGHELQEFEAELASVKDAQLDKLASRQLGDVLREHGRAPALQNTDFFNHQLMQQIEASMPAPAEKPARRKMGWLPRFALASAFSVAAALGIHQMMGPSASPQSALEAHNGFQVIHTQAGDPEITATSFYSQKNDVTVLWLDGAKSMPKKEASPKPADKHEPKN